MAGTVVYGGVVGAVVDQGEELDPPDHPPPGEPEPEGLVAYGEGFVGHGDGEACSVTLVSIFLYPTYVILIEDQRSFNIPVLNFVFYIFICY